MGQGIWGSDNWNEPWVLTFERFHVVDDARRQGWGTKLVTRILREITALARSARNTVVVLVMPAPPEREITAKTVGLSAAAKRRWREESVREARAFWRSLGFVRLGETLFFGWTRSVQSGVVTKQPVSPGDLDNDAAIDRRRGHILRLKN